MSQHRIIKNEQIRAPEVRVLSPESRQLGVMPLKEALRLARECGLDLIEIASTANPPVCRIMEEGKFIFERSKREQAAHAHHSPKMKEITLSANIGEHDLETKLRHGVDFLKDGHPVKLSLRMTGRELIHKEFGFGVVNKAIQALETHGKVNARPKFMANTITAILSPTKTV